MTHRLGESTGFGVERYSYEVYKWMNAKHDLKVFEGIESKMPAFLSDLTYMPFKAFSNNSMIVHALTPRQSLALPHLKKSIVTFHDMIPIEKGHAGRRRDTMSKKYYQVLWRAGTKSKQIAADTNQTKRELIEIFNVDSEKISVVPLGVDKKFRPQSKARRKMKTIGFLTSTIRRKRVDKAIEYFKRYQDKYEMPVKLDIHGALKVKYLECFDPFEIVEGLKVKNVSISGFVPEKKIVEVYNSFDLFLYTSDYEGFGLPIVEAVACGIPTIVRKEARISEELRDLCIVVDENDVEDKMHKTLYDKSYRRKIIRRSLDKAKKFTWENSMKCLEKVYERF